MHACVCVSGVAVHGIVVVVSGVSFVLGSLCACLSRDCLCRRTRRCRRRVPLLPARLELKLLVASSSKGLTLTLPLHSAYASVCQCVCVCDCSCDRSDV